MDCRKGAGDAFRRLGVANLAPVYINDRPDLLDRLADPPARSTTRRPMLRLLLEDPGLASDRLLGVTSVGLCTPVLTYVFGEAQLDGRAAIVSIHRLRPEVYGLPRDDELLYARLDKEAVHELGHTFGLVHCPNPSCVMHASTYAEKIDLKGPGLCERCLGVVREGAGRASAASRAADKT